MKSLETIQKTFNVFRVIAKVAFNLCIVGASLCAVGALCAAVQSGGGKIFVVSGEPINVFPQGTDLSAKCVEFLSTAFMLIAWAILMGFTGGYLKSELADGTPFTEKGAEKLKKIGIRFIYIPIIAIAVSEAVALSLGVKVGLVFGNFGSVATGVVLILVSLVFGYGAELEKNGSQSKTDSIENSDDKIIPESD